MPSRRLPRTLFGPAALLLAALLGFCPAGRAQSPTATPAAPPPGRAAVTIEFLPPPLDNATYSLGIYEAKSGKLVRRLREIAPESAFVVGTNGLVTKWDGKDDNGQPVPPGRYAARGYAVGPMTVAGVDILGNDWAADEDLRIRRVKAITVLEDDTSLAILAEMAGGRSEVASFESPKGELRWHKPMPVDLSAGPPSGGRVPSLAVAGGTIIAEDTGSSEYFDTGDGATGMAFDVMIGDRPANGSYGKEGTIWKIENGVLNQYSKGGERLRQLLPKAGEPIPVAVAASKFNDRLYLLEEKPGWQRLRGLSWVETKEEDGRKVSTWQTFFERNIRAPDAALGLAGPPVPVELRLVENPLEPGKPQTVSLTAGFDAKGSYLTTARGLRLRQISQRPHLQGAKLMPGKAVDSLTFFETDVAAWDEFSIKGANQMMAFDAGEFELTAAGEKPPPEKAPEPPDL
jgi:hypothetical protein